MKLLFVPATLRVNVQARKSKSDSLAGVRLFPFTELKPEAALGKVYCIRYGYLNKECKDCNNLPAGVHHGVSHEDKDVSGGPCLPKNRRQLFSPPLCLPCCRALASALALRLIFSHEPRVADRGKRRYFSRTYDSSMHSRTNTLGNFPRESLFGYRYLVNGGDRSPPRYTPYERGKGKRYIEKRRAQTHRHTRAPM